MDVSKRRIVNTTFDLCERNVNGTSHGLVRATSDLT